MIVNLPTPPRPTGDNNIDIKAMNEWCITLHRKLVGILRNLDGFNITAVPSDRLTGTIPEELLPVTETAEVSTMSLREESADVTDTEETDTV